MFNQLQARIIKNIQDSHISIGKLEKQAGLKRNSIRNIIDGRSKNPSIETLMSIAAIMGCSLDNLVSDNPSDFLNQNQENKIITKHLWDKKLFEETLNLTQNIVTENNSQISFEQMLEFIQEIYLFSVGKEDSTEKTVDKRFAKWIVEKSL